MWIVITLLACRPDDNPTGGTTPHTGSPTDDTGPSTGSSTGHTGTPTLPGGLQVRAAPAAPGALHLSDPTGDTDWAIQVAGTRFAPGPDGVAAVVGLGQGASVDATLLRGGVEVGVIPLTVAPAPVRWTVTVHDAARSALASGVLSTGIVARPGTDASLLVIDGATGALQWWHDHGPDWDMSAAGANVEGDGFVWGQYDSTRASMGAQLVELSLDGRRHLVLDTPSAHHVAIEPVAGRYAFIEFDVREDTPSDFGPLDITSDRIVEVDAAGGDRTVLFTAIDDLFGGTNPYTCTHNQKTEELFGLDAMVQWTHGNSLAYLPESDAYLLYERWIDTLVKVGRDGSIVWRLSGPFSDFSAPNGDSLWIDQDRSPLWSHGHFTDGWEGGVLMYDNGSHSRDARVVEVTIDDAAMTAEVAWSHPAPNGGVHTVLGDARRLPNGNVLICWTVLGLIQEVTRDGDVVWELQGEADLWFSRVLFAPSLGELGGGAPGPLAGDVSG